MPTMGAGMDRTFSTGDVILAAGVTNPVLQSWLKRGLIIGERDGRIDGGGAPGNRRRFEYSSLMEIATAKALIDATSGMDLQTAFKVADEFAHFGEGRTPTWDDGMSDVRPARLGGYPFHFMHGDTFLAVAGGQAEIALVPKGGDAYRAAQRALGHRASVGLVVLDLTELFCRVCYRLQIDPFDSLNAVYPEDAEAFRKVTG